MPAQTVDQERSRLGRVSDTVLYDLMREACTRLGGVYFAEGTKAQEAGEDRRHWDEQLLHLDRDAAAIGARDRNAQIEAILRWNARRAQLRGSSDAAGVITAAE